MPSVDGRSKNWRAALSHLDSRRIVALISRLVIAKFASNGHRYPLGSLAQGRLVEMDVAVRCICSPMTKQASRDLQAFTVHNRARGACVSQVVEPRIRHDAGRIARPGPERPMVIRTQRPVSLAAWRHSLPGRRFRESVQQLPRRLAEKNVPRFRLRVNQRKPVWPALAPA